MKAFVVCCLLAVGLASEVRESGKRRVTRSNCYDQGWSAPAPYMAPAPYAPAYDIPAYSPPAYPPPSPVSFPPGTYSGPPTPIAFHAPKPTVTTILIHNAEAPPPRPSPASPFKKPNPFGAASSSYSAPSPSYSAPSPYSSPSSYGSPSAYNSYRS